MSVRWHYQTDHGGRPVSLLKTLMLEELLDKWPMEVIAPGDVIGPLTRAAAEHLGLKADIPVVQGGADAFIGMVGLGVTEPGEMALITGSSHLHLGVAASPVHKPGVWGTYMDAVYPGKAIIEGGQTSTGSVIAWFKGPCRGCLQGRGLPGMIRGAVETQCAFLGEFGCGRPANPKRRARDDD